MTTQTPTQAERVFDLFGGVPATHRALAAVGAKRSLSAIYRWNLNKSKGGTGGRVPSTAMQEVLKAARLEGVVVPPEVLYPVGRA